MNRRYLCRQFLLSENETIPFEGWITCTTKSRFLHHHPDLPVSQLKSQSRCLTLIGYLIDAANPGASDVELLDDLFHALRSKTQFLAQAKQLAGRWILVAETAQFSIAVHDACGLRQLFYSDSSSPVRFCASEASTAAKVFDLEVDAEADQNFLGTENVKSQPEYWWPGDATHYRGVRALLPNHYFDLELREAARYGLDLPVGELNLDDAAEMGAIYLSNLIRAAGARFELALPLTAGWDSRAILAGCRAASVKPYCYTLRFGAMSEGSQDLAVPRRILTKLRWDHHIIDCRQAANPEFVTVYKSSTDPAHDEACQLAYGLLREYPRERVTLSGHCSEIARCSYGSRPNSAINPEELAKTTNMDQSKFVLSNFSRWLDGAKGAAETSGIAMTDLFYWEQRVGRWAANGQSQWDIVHERFTPFSCRPLLYTLLATHAKDRALPRCRLYHKMIKILSSSLLADPINPDMNPKSWRLSSLTRMFTSLAS
jgi:hypothetical protein